MATINGTVGKNGYSFYAVLSETLPSNYLATNVSTVKYQVYIKNGNKRTNSSNWTFNAKIDGTDVYNKTSQSLVTNDTDYNAAKLLFSGTKDITHNNDGSKTITFSASLTKTTAYSDYDPGACSLSGSFTLTTIPRYADFTSHSIEETLQTKVIISWSADSNVDLVEYSLNNGFWVTPSETTDSSYTINNLLQGVPYSIKTRIRRAESGLYTVSERLVAITKKNITKVNQNGVWKQAIPFIEQENTIPYININGEWN